MMGGVSSRFCVKRHQWCIQAVAVAAAFAMGCRDQQLLAPPPPSFAVARAPVTGGYWASVSDSALWKELTRVDTTLNIGLKLPGQGRGVVRGRAQVDKTSWIGYIHAVLKEDGARLVTADSVRFPLVTVKVRDVATLMRLRRLPFVDFAEPVHVPTIYFGELGCSSGSSNGSSTGDDAYGGPLDAVINVFGGHDYVGAPFYQSGAGMNIFNAWKLTAGQGVTVGVTDTGVDTIGGTVGQSEFSGAYVNAGSSAGRTFKYIKDYTISDGLESTCSHGTRITGLALGPRNGRSVVGVAWLSNIFEYWQDNSFDPARGNAGRAIDSSGTNGAKVIMMAWGMLTGSDLISNTIDDWYYNHDVMFVGAAGTCGPDWICPRQESAFFPASKAEVLAVTGAAHDGSRPGVDYWYGTKGGVTAFQDLPTTGWRRPDLVTLGGTSGATGIVGGVAALVRAYNPQMTNRQVMDRLIYTAGFNCASPASWTNSIVNASAAVGGACVSPLHNAYYDRQYIQGTSPSPMPVFVNVFTSFGANHQMLPPGGPFPGASDPYPPGPHTLGGSGSYQVDWTIPPGADAVDSPSSANYTDYQSGDTYWQQARNFNIKPAADGLPYMAVFKVNVTDNGRGTVDTRVDSILVCPSTSNCSYTTRPWPAFAYINGPSYISAPGSYTWTTSYQGPNEPYTISWEVSYDGGYTYGSFAQGPSVTLYFDTGESYTMMLRTSVTTQTGATGQSVYSVQVNTACPQEIFCY